jgi:hypothetical protein
MPVFLKERRHFALYKEASVSRCSYFMPLTSMAPLNSVASSVSLPVITARFCCGADALPGDAILKRTGGNIVDGASQAGFSPIAPILIKAIFYLVV